MLANRIGRISPGGVIAGITCGALIYAAFYLAGFTVLGTALVLTIAASRLGRNHRRADTVAEDDRRGAANIFANCGVAMLAAVAELSSVGLRMELTALWCVCAIAAGASDTVASEIGKAFGGRPRSFPTWVAVAPGTPGAISGIGTFAGVAAAALIALPAVALWLLPPTALVLVAMASTAGAFVESWLATALESRGRINNHALNAVNTAIAASIAVFLAQYSRT